MKDHKVNFGIFKFCVVFSLLSCSLSTNILAEDDKKTHTKATLHQHGSFYLRLGGGIGSDNAYSEAVLKSSNQLGWNALDIVGFANLGVGLNHYFRSPLFMGCGFSMDVIFNDSFAPRISPLVKFGADDITGLLIEGKFRAGFYFSIKEVRSAFYVLLGAVGRITNYINPFHNDKTEISGSGGVTAGAGFTVGSMRYPVSMYLEVSFPVLFGLRTVETNKQSDLFMSLSPRAAVGVMIGY